MVVEFEIMNCRLRISRIEEIISGMEKVHRIEKLETRLLLSIIFLTNYIVREPRTFDFIEEIKYKILPETYSIEH